MFGAYGTDDDGSNPRIQIPEFVVIDGERVKHWRVPECVRHESAHAFDHFSGLSEEAEFVKLFESERKRIDAVDDATRRDSLRSTIGPPAASVIEFIPEAFAILHGGGTDAEADDLIKAWFPKTLKEVSRGVKDFR